MDADNRKSANGPVEVHQNDRQEECPVFKEVSHDLDKANGDINDFAESVALSENIENAIKLEDHGNADSQEIVDEGSNTIARDGSAVQEGAVPEGIDHLDQSRPYEVQVKGKVGSVPITGHRTTIGAKKSKDGKTSYATSTVSNSSLASNSHPKSSFKSLSSSDLLAHVSKQPMKSGPTSPTTSEALVKKTKPKPPKKGPPSITEADMECPVPTIGDAKPHREGMLPNYGFSFRCNERAEKRKEFYSKLEEKIHAKEVEKSSRQAKSKETTEAEIKLFRKSLTFKATPMPRFYQEPPPPKAELKKIALTRAKSPKLGRRKSLPPADVEGDSGSNSSQSGRLSLDEKSSRKPRQRSLPRLPSQKINSSDLNKEGTRPPAQNYVLQRGNATPELSESKQPASDVAVVVGAEEQVKPKLGQESIAVEQQN